MIARVPDAVQRVSGAPQIRDLRKLSVRNDPGSASHHHKHVHARLRALWCCAAPGKRGRGQGAPVGAHRRVTELAPLVSQACRATQENYQRASRESWTMRLPKEIAV